MNRDKNVDYKILKAYGFTHVWHQPWQLGLFHPDISGKHVWYPEKGTLMREDVGTYKIGEYFDTEDVVAKMTCA